MEWVCCKADQAANRIEVSNDKESEGVITVLKDNRGKTIEPVVELDIREDLQIVPIQEGAHDSPKSAPGANPALSAGWEPFIDASTNNTYYYNRATNETTWTRPVALGTDDVKEDDAGQCSTKEPPASDAGSVPDKKTLDDLDAESGGADAEKEIVIDISHLPSKITNLTSSKLLRAVSVTQVLSGGGKQWAGVIKGGPSLQHSEVLHKRSKEVTQYKEYLSHRRLDARYKKVITLLIYYNGVPAGIMGTIVAIVMCVLRVLDYLPAGTVNDSANAGKIAPWSVSAGYATFLLCLFFWHRLPQCMLGSSGRAIFADNYCINYSNATEKEKGIRNFIGYISQSERVLVMWSGDYFSRLWTTLEIAAAVIVSTSKDHSGAPLQRATKKPLVFRPLTLNVMTFWGGFLSFISYLISILTRMTRFTSGLSATAMQTISLMVIAVIVWPVVVHALQVMLHDRRELKMDLDSFDAHEGEEEDADEREFIFSTISEMWGGVPQFNNYVRTQVYDAIGSALGSARALPVYAYVFGMLPMFWAQLDYGVYYFDFYSEEKDRAIEYCINQVAVVACIFAQFPVLVIFLRGFEMRAAEASVISSLIIGTSHAFFFLFQVGGIIALSEVGGLLWPSIACAGGYLLFAIIVGTCASCKC